MLEGAFPVDDVVVRAGDYQFAAADSDHAEHRSPEGCWCWSAPDARPRGGVGRVGHKISAATDRFGMRMPLE